MPSVVSPLPFQSTGLMRIVSRSARVFTVAWQAVHFSTLTASVWTSWQSVHLFERVLRFWPLYFWSSY